MMEKSLTEKLEQADGMEEMFRLLAEHYPNLSITDH